MRVLARQGPYSSYCNEKALELVPGPKNVEKKKMRVLAPLGLVTLVMLAARASFLTTKTRLRHTAAC